MVAKYFHSNGNTIHFVLIHRYRNEVKHIKIPYEEGAFYLTKAIAFPSVEVRGTFRFQRWQHSTYFSNKPLQ